MLCISCFFVNGFTQAPNDSTLTRRPVRPKYRYSIRSLGFVAAVDMMKDEYLKKKKQEFLLFLLHYCFDVLI
jgi:hypothetical protein